MQQEPTEGEIKAYLSANAQEEVYTTCIKLSANKVKELLNHRLDCDLESLDLTKSEHIFLNMMRSSGKKLTLITYSYLRVGHKERWWNV